MTRKGMNMTNPELSERHFFLTKPLPHKGDWLPEFLLFHFSKEGKENRRILLYRLSKCIHIEEKSN